MPRPTSSSPALPCGDVLGRRLYDLPAAKPVPSADPEIDDLALAVAPGAGLPVGSPGIFEPGAIGSGAQPFATTASMVRANHDTAPSLAGLASSCDATFSVRSHFVPTKTSARRVADYDRRAFLFQDHAPRRMRVAVVAGSFRVPETSFVFVFAFAGAPRRAWSSSLHRPKGVAVVQFSLAPSRPVARGTPRRCGRRYQRHRAFLLSALPGAQSAMRQLVTLLACYLAGVVSSREPEHLRSSSHRPAMSAAVCPSRVSHWPLLPWPCGCAPARSTGRSTPARRATDRARARRSSRRAAVHG